MSSQNGSLLTHHTSIPEVRSAEKVRRPVILHARGVTGFGGGPEKTILNSPRFYRRFGYEAICAYLHPPQDPGFASLVKRAQAADARLVSVPDRGPLDWRIVRDMVRLCREEQVDIYHAHDYKTDALGLLLQHFWPMHLVTTVHGWALDTLKAQVYHAIDKWSLRYYREVVCVSQELMEECARWDVPRSRLKLIHNAIDTEQFRRHLPVAEAKRVSPWSAPSEGLLLGAMGRLSVEKGFDILIRAVVKLVQSGHRLTLWIAGEGDARPALERLIQDLGCGSYVRLLGQIANPIDFYLPLDLYVLSSLHEGLPNVVLESMALEVPVVATRVGAVRNLILDGQTGIEMDPGDEAGLVAGLRRMVEQPELRQRCIRAARELIETSYSLEERMRKMCAIYDQLLAGTTPAE